MRFSIQLTGRKILLRGVGGLLLILLILTLPHIFAARLSPSQAESEIRDYLGRQLTAVQLSQLSDRDLTVPDQAMAVQWQTDRQRLKDMKFSTLSVRNFLFTPPFVTSRIFVVQTRLQYDGEPLVTRYFSITARSRHHPLYWVNESGVWFWRLAR